MITLKHIILGLMDRECIGDGILYDLCDFAIATKLLFPDGDNDYEKLRERAKGLSRSIRGGIH